MVNVVDKKGNRFKKDIKDIQIGDTVLALDEFTSIISPRLVTETIHDPVGQPLLRLYVESVETPIDVTYAHKFYVENRENKWIPAADLLPGEVLTRYIPESGEVIKTSLSSVEKLNHLEPTYNLEVEEDHTYMVEGVVVHNGRNK